ncbi:RNA-binding protein [Paenibacillus sp. MY03]|uniref:NYN domain-containing protein n=1 Tax=unclassified Paenibacillus TaxID=185978 RepID=UPI000B3C9092|nr:MULTISPECIES: NYN domain-containing protein [unclassified Paenibacillus]OUS73331.1 RNA-binding protein [Paenibacillus sp. MY03]QNK58462.1 NYN domain-containing protein [Paenibacillus sp. PAMC21692]
MNRPNDVLLVDGYNIIGAWPVLEKLKESDLEDARDKLLDMLADYQGFSGMEIYVIFDAHQVPGLGATYKQHKLTVVYTKEKETADECIERLCSELMVRRRSIYVATSDLVEQHVAFGKGALRLSARELLIDINQNRKLIEQNIRERETKPIRRNSVDENVSLDVWSKLERLRRGEE